MKTTELTGAALDYAVALCEGYISMRRPLVMKGVILLHMREGFYSPSTEWSDGGPIIEKAKIGIDWFNNTWNAFKDPVKEDDELHGDTPLMAAMRLFVQMNVGDEIEIPEEFLQ